MFLDIDIGDAAAYQAASDEYSRAAQFLSSVGEQVRLPWPMHRVQCSAVHFSVRCCCGIDVSFSMTSSVGVFVSGPPLLQYGLSGAKPEDLDEDQTQLLLDAYNNDKAWASKGPASTKAPPPIRAGRIVCELFDAEARQQPNRN